MEDAARRAGRPDAAAAIVDDLFGWLGVPSQAPPDPEREAQADSDDELQSMRPVAESQPPIRRKPRVKRAELRMRAIDVSLDVMP
jgi:hypothetical protein